MRYVTLHSRDLSAPIGDLSSSLGGEYALVSRIFLPIKNKMSSYFLGIKTRKKVDLSEVSQTHFLRQTIDLLPDIVKTHIVPSKSRVPVTGIDNFFVAQPSQKLFTGLREDHCPDVWFQYELLTPNSLRERSV